MTLQVERVDDTDYRAREQRPVQGNLMARQAARIMATVCGPHLSGERPFLATAPHEVRKVTGLAVLRTGDDIETWTRNELEPAIRMLSGSLPAKVRAFADIRSVDPLPFYVWEKAVSEARGVCVLVTMEMLAKTATLWVGYV